MPQFPEPRRWTRHFLYRTEHTRTTWKFRFAIVALVVIAVWLTRGWWSVTIARSLVCDRNGAPSDAILVENFDPDYLVFERAARLRRAGFAARRECSYRSRPTRARPNPMMLRWAQRR